MPRVRKSTLQIVSDLADESLDHRAPPRPGVILRFSPSSHFDFDEERELNHAVLYRVCPEENKVCLARPHSALNLWSMMQCCPSNTEPAGISTKLIIFVSSSL